jgi:hypothetical protein
VKLADIHHQICTVYGENAMSDGMVRKWVIKFNKGCDNMHEEPCSGRPSMVCADLVSAVEVKVREDTWFTILSLSLHFQQISRTVLYKIVTDCLDFWKLCSHWVTKTTLGCTPLLKLKPSSNHLALNNTITITPPPPPHLTAQDLA